jgi:hypothetical protein
MTGAETGERAALEAALKAWRKRCEKCGRWECGYCLIEKRKLEQAAGQPDSHGGKAYRNKGRELLMESGGFLAGFHSVPHGTENLYKPEKPEKELYMEEMKQAAQGGTAPEAREEPVI